MNLINVELYVKYILNKHFDLMLSHYEISQNISTEMLVSSEIHLTTIM